MNETIANSIDQAVDNAYAAGYADAQRDLAARLAAVEALPRWAVPAGYIGARPGIGTATVVHWEALRAVVRADPSETTRD